MPTYIHTHTRFYIITCFFFSSWCIELYFACKIWFARKQQLMKSVKANFTSV